ncbi:MAG: GNAT family N-acetyltransferase [Fimbriimonas ginsengisoli]|nr:GNAT family N-acetyltransferase [Fimbriimonas ginsengisoli]
MTDASLPLLLYARRFRRIAELTMREIPRPVTRKTLPGPSKHRLSHWQSKGLIMRVRIDFRHGTAITGQVIGDPNEWGKGYGSDAAKVRARYAFEVLNLRLLLSEVFEDNERSLRTLEKVGYVEYGRCPKKYWVRGRYVDSILVALDRDRWLSLNP